MSGYITIPGEGLSVVENEPKPIGSEYPYKEGWRGSGIDFVNLFKLADSNNGFWGTDENPQLITSGSGKKLKVIINPRKISITENKNIPYFVLNAQIEDELEYPVFTFGVKTRENVIKLFGQEIRRPHSDFFASKFTRMAFEKLQSNLEVPIANIYGNWSWDSDNFAQFASTLKETGDKTEAAKSTWTYKLAKEFGFTEVAETDVKIMGKPRFLKPHVDVLFTRPEFYEVTSKQREQFFRALEKNDRFIQFRN